MDHEEPFDMTVAMHYLDGDRAIFEGLAAVLKEESKRQFGEMRAAIARSNAETVARLAHTIKGLVSTFGARRSVEAARRLEVLSDQGNPADLLPAVIALEEELELLNAALAKAVEGPSSGG
jgi:two-component system, sensor histidine kinase and response regulator